MERNDIILDFFVKHIKKLLGPRLKNIILFGSKARGDDASGSDYDILVIVDKVYPEIDDIIDEIGGSILYEYNTIVSSFVITQEKYNTQIYNPLFMNIRKDGIKL